MKFADTSVPYVYQNDGSEAVITGEKYVSRNEHWGFNVGTSYDMNIDFKNEKAFKGSVDIRTPIFNI